jgi:hypothetical protein
MDALVVADLCDIIYPDFLIVRASFSASLFRSIKKVLDIPLSTIFNRRSTLPTTASTSLAVSEMKPW